MDASSVLDSSYTRQTLHPQDVADHILAFIRNFSPILVLCFFLVAFTLRSIRATSDIGKSNDDARPPVQYGPGGKPLPQRTWTGLQRKKDKENDMPRSRKLVFQWISLGTVLTFTANAVVVVVHALAQRGWWCGEPTTVSLTPSPQVWIWDGNLIHSC
jgi:hypothetical protein